VKGGRERLTEESRERRIASRQNDAEQRLGCGSAPTLDVRDAETRDPWFCITSNDRNGSAWRMAFSENAPDLGAQFVGRRGTLPAFSRVGRHGKQRAGEDAFSA